MLGCMRILAELVLCRFRALVFSASAASVVDEVEERPVFDSWSSSNLERMAGMRLATVESILPLEPKAEVDGVGVKELLSR
ncbi:hypothetical protein CPC08DRAFT_709971 [Agrocybe pediades]|nr:hypothetical protein CPC08DRAFT_709971 [Agrocybe pediades]